MLLNAVVRWGLSSHAASSLSTLTDHHLPGIRETHAHHDPRTALIGGWDSGDIRFPRHEDARKTPGLVRGTIPGAAPGLTPPVRGPPALRGQPANGGRATVN